MASSNISREVLDMIRRRTQGEIPPAVSDVEQPGTEPEEVRPPVNDELPELDAPVLVAPEDDNPPEIPQDGKYHYQSDVVITPDRARHLLDLNAENNRRKKESKVTGYARDMRKGLWKSRTGETVKVSSSGVMIDGQNRMHAVVRAGVPVTFDIVWNVPDDRMQVIDAGAPRTTADDFRIAGVADRTQAGALVQWALAWEKGNYMNHGGRMTPTRQEKLARYLQEPHAFDQAAMFGRATHNRVGNVVASAAALAFWLFAKMPDGGAEQAEVFFDQLIEGLELKAGSPVAALLARFNGRTGHDLTRQEQLALMIKAWNMFRSGRVTTPTSRVTLPKDRLTNDNFPMPV